MKLDLNDSAIEQIATALIASDRQVLIELTQKAMAKSNVTNNELENILDYTETIHAMDKVLEYYGVL